MNVVKKKIVFLDHFEVIWITGNRDPTAGY